MSVAQLSAATHKRLEERDRWPTTEADALCYKFLLQYLAESEVLKDFSVRAASGPINIEEMWKLCNAQKIAVHLALVEKFPQFEYMHMLSFGIDLETSSPCAIFVTREGITTADNSRKVREENDLARTEAVNEAFRKMFTEYLHVDEENDSFYFEWTPLDEPLAIRHDNLNGTKH